jgi:hypothetical protein
MTEPETLAQELRRIGRQLADLYCEDRGAIRRLRLELHMDRETLDGLVAWGVDLPATSRRGKGRPRRIAGYGGQSGPEGESLSGAEYLPETSDKGIGDLGHGEGPRRCDLCRREYVAGRADSVYCSPRCTDLVSRQRRGEDISEQLAAILDPPRCHAPGCDDVIPNWRLGKLYCDDACRKRAQRERSRS